MKLELQVSDGLDMVRFSSMLLLLHLLGSLLIWVIVKNCVETSGLAVIVIVEALSVKNTVEGSRVCVRFKMEVCADRVTISELRKVVVMNSEVTNVEAGRVVVWI